MTLKTIRLTALFFLSCSLLLPQTKAVSEAPAGMNSSIPMCKASDLSLGLDSENGNFDGMSHSGTLVVLRNLSETACRMPAIPQLTFFDGSKALAFKPELPGSRFMHPGPVMTPVVVPPRAELTSALSWVSSAVFTQSVCVTPSTLSVAIGAGKQQAPFGLRICADKTKGVTYKMTPFVTDPVYKK